MKFTKEQLKETIQWQIDEALEKIDSFRDDLEKTYVSAIYDAIHWKGESAVSAEVILDDLKFLAEMADEITLENLGKVERQYQRRTERHMESWDWAQASTNAISNELKRAQAKANLELIKRVYPQFLKTYRELLEDES